MPQSLIGVSVFIWRLLLTYFPAIVASFFLTKEFGRDKNLKQMVMDKIFHSDDVERDEDFHDIRK